jgi:hypothetical protein
VKIDAGASGVSALTCGPVVPAYRSSISNLRAKPRAIDNGPAHVDSIPAATALIGVPPAANRSTPFIEVACRTLAAPRVSADWAATEAAHLRLAVFFLTSSRAVEPIGTDPRRTADNLSRHPEVWICRPHYRECHQPF